ncbi:hypothetical protein ASPWEDRAFT_196500 [Aspergillus wentii DTO 134E9]|uniref:UDP-galactose transporter n=1 Tax=Aspergillus wentii DTO 134E9 TaxID=1073089 RepID=A0A1L9RZA8_ASPWE|nr:uncharacterized protein ASPWEDRAFT_196500 [Aspergillus wentii DTO 134E9]OJJ40269.1 hypothetical protein ASPWEDRAFT_196500 [Aspergillus wentii DTO 134E9]
MPPAGGKRYLTSTAVFLNEVIKLAISLTMALYEVSKAAPPSMPATSLFFSLTSVVFSGDSWKLAIPACLYTLANSLQYVALSNLQAATFQVTYQLKLVPTAIFGLVLLRRATPLRKWGLLLLLLVGVSLVQMPNSSTDEIALEEETAHLAFPRSLEEWKAARGGSAGLHKRSATYEGIEEDIQTAFPRMNSTIGLLATVGACAASALAGVYFEKVIRDSSASASLWIRNVQLAFYSIFPSLFIGVIFLDGENISANGFFGGYSWAVWSTVVVQAFGGILASFCMMYTHQAVKNLSTATSILLSTVGSVWLFEFEVTGRFFLGSLAVLVATYLQGDSGLGIIQRKSSSARPPPIRVDSYDNEIKGDAGSPESPSPNEISIKLPGTPFLDAGVSTSRPTSPGHARVSSARTTSGGYFDKHPRDE